jgi:hypothetical protein
MVEVNSEPIDNQLMNDERGVVLNWLAKMILGLVIGGVILFDAGSIVVNYFGLDSAADEVAAEISLDIATGGIPEFELRTIGQCKRQPSANTLCQSIQSKVKAHEAKLIKVTLDLQGNLKVRMRRTADTLVVKRIGPIEDWGTATAEGKASTETQ